MDTLTVELNRDSPYKIDVASRSFEVHGSFDIVIQNHGSSTHTHFQLDDELARVATLDVTNYFVKGDQVQRIPVTVRGRNRPVRGRLKITTGYGSNTEYVEIEITDRNESKSKVQVDERLAKPQRRDEEPLIRTDQLPVIALGIIALFVALVTGLIIGGWVAIVGVFIVLIGVGIAGLFLLE